MLEIIEQYLKNEQKIQEISAAKDNFSEAKNAEIKHLEWDIYHKKIRKLEDERDQKVNLVQKQIDNHRETSDQQISRLNQVIEEVERIIYFLTLDKSRNLEIADDSIKVYRNRRIESLGYLYSDEFLKIKFFIVENDKPKNKYDLIACGKCLFDDPVMKLPYSYGLNIHSSSCNIQVEFKCAPDIETLKQHFEKRKDTLLKTEIAEYLNVKTKYLECLGTYKLSDIEPLIQYRCRHCGFFLTAKAARGYCIRDNQCPHCQAAGFTDEKHLKHTNKKGK